MKKTIWLVIATTVCIICIMDCHADTDKAEIIREPAFAGQFYPADGEDLQTVVNKHLDNVVDLPRINGQIIALIAPHAGLVYSGQIAAYSYKILQNSGVNKVILIGPSHRFPFEGISVFGPGVRWRTPLGMIDCHDELCGRLIEQDRKIDIIPQAHEQEHCLEVQLPYLQTVLDDFSIVPAIMGRPTGETVNLLADVLTSLEFDSQAVMIASTDWQHYHPASVGWPMDSLGIECLKSLNVDLLQKKLGEGKVEACGGGSVVAVMKAAIAHGANRVKILKYGDSGDITGDKNSVVSYLAAVIYRDKKAETPKKGDLSENDKEKLLKIARRSIETFLKTRQAPEFDVPRNLKEPGAAFVTLEKHGRLRGCIGYTEAVDPLYETVSRCAIQAAVADPRFPPVRYDEMADIHIEISVLTPLQRVKSFEEIEVGRDGLMIFKGNNRGLLLPQVAAEYGWGREEFLKQTCRKAGLAQNAYKSDDAEVYKFQAIIFGE